MSKPTPRQQLEAFRSKFSADIAASARVSLRDFRNRLPGATEIVYVNYNALAIRLVVASARNWAHYLAVLVGGSAVLVLYSVLFRFALIPRVLAAFGLASVMLLLAAVVMPLFGHGVVFLMLMPLAGSNLALALWMIAKGLR